jgi:hypothetical protein
MELMQENIITDRTIIDVMAFARASKSMDHVEKYDFEQLAMLLIKEYDYIELAEKKLGMEVVGGFEFLLAPAPRCWRTLAKLPQCRLTAGSRAAAVRLRGLQRLRVPHLAQEL